MGFIIEALGRKLPWDLKDVEIISGCKAWKRLQEGSSCEGVFREMNMLSTDW